MGPSPCSPSLPRRSHLRPGGRGPGVWVLVLKGGVSQPWSTEQSPPEGKSPCWGRSQSEPPRASRANSRWVRPPEPDSSGADPTGSSQAKHPAPCQGEGSLWFPPGLDAGPGQPRHQGALPPRPGPCCKWLPPGVGRRLEGLPSISPPGLAPLRGGGPPARSADPAKAAFQVTVP